MGASEKKQKKKNGKKPRHIFRKIILWLIVLALLGGAGYYGYLSLRTEHTTTYQPYTASIGTISNALSFNGTLQAIDNASYTAEGSGTVRAVYASAGDRVKKGDKLVRLSNGQTVEAEFDGTVNVMSVKQGDDVVAGDSLCQVVDFTHLKTNIRVDEYDINSVHVGDAVRVTTTANDKTFDSSIAELDHVSGSSGNVAYYTATAYVDVEDEVYPGMQVTVTLTMEEAADVVVLKMTAISFDESNNAFVYTMDENGEMQKTYITTGVSNGNYVEIKSGLAEGNTVYVEVKTEDNSAAKSILSMFDQTTVMPSGDFGGFDFGGGGDFNPGSFPGGGAGGSGGPSGGRGGSGSFGGFGGGNR